MFLSLGSPMPRKPATAYTEATKPRLIGAELPPVYQENVRLLHATTGRPKKELMQEALDMLFARYADKLPHTGANQGGPTQP